MTARTPRDTRILALLTLIALPFCLLQTARAGGPKYVAGASYFNSGTMGVPLTWARGEVNYHTDQGDLSPIVSGPSADALVADAFSQWTSIRSEEHTSELQSRAQNSYAVFCLDRKSVV